MKSISTAMRLSVAAALAGVMAFAQPVPAEAAHGGGGGFHGGGFHGGGFHGGGFHGGGFHGGGFRGGGWGLGAAGLAIGTGIALAATAPHAYGGYAPYAYGGYYDDDYYVYPRYTYG